MAFPSVLEIAQKDLFSPEDELRSKYTEVLVMRLLRIRDMYLWTTANPDAKDREFVSEVVSRYSISRVTAYADLAVIKSLLPTIGEAARDFHRWRYNEMILETYQMAKKRKDTKTMEKAASSYAKYNRIELESDTKLPYDMIVVQQFAATSDPTVLGIKPIPNINKVINNMIAKYRKDCLDIDDVEYEPADIEILE